MQHHSNTKSPTRQSTGIRQTSRCVGCAPAAVPAPTPAAAGPMSAPARLSWPNQPRRSGAAVPTGAAADVGVAVGDVAGSVLGRLDGMPATHFTL